MRVQTKLSKRKWTISLIAAVVALAVIGVAVYWAIGQALTNQGIKAHNELDAYLAVQKYDRVIAHYSPALGEFVALAAKNQAICRAYLDARQAASNRNYETAIALYAQFRTTHPTDPLIVLVDREHPAAYLAWAKEAEQAGAPQTAIERYQILLFTYPSSPQASQAERAIPAVYYAAGAAGRAQTSYAEAIASFQLAQETDVDAAWTAKAQQAIWETYGEWGDAQREHGEYERAISHYQRAIAETDNTQVIAALEQAIAESILAWSRTLRTQGEYEQAIAMCKAAMSDLPVATWQEQIHEAIQTTTLEWADALHAGHDYRAAIATWQSYAATYPNSDLDQVELDIAGAYAAWAQRHWDNSEYQDALLLYETLITTYPDAAPAKRARSMLPSLHYDWAAAAHRAQEFETAIVHYQASIALEEQQPPANEQIHPPRITAAAQTDAARAYLDWGEVLSRTRTYQDAIIAYEKAIAVDTNGRAASNARARLPGAYLAWGQSLQEAGLYDTALVTYQAILDTFPQHPAANAAAVAIGETYSAWGAALHAQGAYGDAMLKFGLAVETTDDERVAVEAQSGYDSALWALAHLTDATGRQIIADAVTTACQGKAAISPAVGLALAQEHSGAGKAAINSDLIALPTSLKAVLPAHLNAALCLTTGFTEIQRCAYSNGYALVRQQVWWKITVRDASSGMWLAENTFTGSMPKNCPDSYLFYAKIVYLDGSRPASAEIVNWLRLNNDAF
ncbi:MAG: tetratricopeptide repeat protein [Anaerolineae bacterium]|nr:tetratricopeptide repeat protein [Anaerolineae bacterium]